MIRDLKEVRGDIENDDEDEDDEEHEDLEEHELEFLEKRPVRF